MKSAPFLLISILFFFVITTPVFAENASRSSKIRENKMEFKEKRLEIRKEFKEKIKTIRDEKKRQILERLDEKFSRINTRRVEHWRKVLARLEEILTKADDSQTASAREKIQVAKNAVDVQESKVYSVNITSETALKQNAQTTISEMHADFKNIASLIEEAKVAVKQAIMESKKL